MMHGMNEKATHVQRNVDAVRKKYPGIYVTSLRIYEGMSSMLTGIEKQLEAVVKAIQSDGNLTDGFNFYGESQGALLARAYVTTVNDPPVHNLAALNGPQAGVGECPKIEIPGLKSLCGTLGTDLDIYHWPDCSFCHYWKGRSESVYLKNSEWLLDSARTFSTSCCESLLSKASEAPRETSSLLAPGTTPWNESAASSEMAPGRAF